MEFNLEEIGIEKGLQYECIYTTENSKGEKNAGPFGFKYLGDDRVSCTLFEGSQTLKNIMETKKYTVNITEDPLIFTYATIGNLPDEYFDDELAVIKDVPAYLTIEVESIEEADKDKFPLKNEKSLYLIEGKITDMKINNRCAHAYNRGLSSLIECLVNYSRYFIVDDEMKAFYENRLDENQRIINKVSDKKTQEAIAYLKDNMLKNK